MEFSRELKRESIEHLESFLWKFLDTDTLNNLAPISDTTQCVQLTQISLPSSMDVLIRLHIPRACLAVSHNRARTRRISLRNWEWAQLIHTNKNFLLSQWPKTTQNFQSELDDSRERSVAQLEFDHSDKRFTSAPKCSPEQCRESYFHNSVHLAEAFRPDERCRPATTRSTWSSWRWWAISKWVESTAATFNVKSEVFFFDEPRIFFSSQMTKRK